MKTLIEIGVIILVIIFLVFIYSIMVAASWADDREFEDLEQTRFIEEQMNKKKVNKG